MTSSRSESLCRWRQTIRYAPLGAILVFAAALTWAAGRRGFFPFDQSIVFDGAYRIVCGQVPYKDFLMPLGPVVFWIQACLFRLGGVNYQMYLAHAAIANCLAALCAYSILRKIYPQRSVWACVSAGITAIWFYPPSGTPWPEQTAFLFALAALTVAVWTSAIADLRGLFACSGLCGGFIALAFLSKQNAGLFSGIAAATVLALVHVSSRPRLAAICVGMLCGAAFVWCMLGAWLLWTSDVANFWKYFWTLPSEEGRSRLFRDWRATAMLALLGSGPETRNASPSRAVLGVWLSGLTALAVLAFRWRESRWSTWFEPFALIAVFFALAAIVLKSPSLALLAFGVLVVRWVVRHWKPQIGPRASLAALLTLAGIVSQNFVLATLNNHPANAFPLLGIVLAIWGGSALDLVHQAASPWRRLFKPIFLACYSLVVVLVVHEGMRIGLNREAQWLFGLSEFNSHCEVPILRDVIWADKAPMPPEELEAAVGFLSQRQSRFVVFYDFTLLYSMLDQPPPQPLLWFHGGLTYRGDDPELDRWIARSLEDHDVQIVVFMQGPWTQVDIDLATSFPQTFDLVARNFAPAETIGSFRFLERTAPSLPRRPAALANPDLGMIMKTRPCPPSLSQSNAPPGRLAAD